MRKFVMLWCITIGTLFSQICYTDEIYEELKEKNTLLIHLEEKTEKIHNNNLRTNNIPIITIPVVVHIVYREQEENILSSVVSSQMQVLNEDFRKLNSDTIDIPQHFKHLAADMEIEFCLAKIAPDGTPTEGITRTKTSVREFVNWDDVKNPERGGKAPWPVDRYLNIWVCDIPHPYIAGYAQFPWSLKDNPETDGIVVDYVFFGRPPYVPSTRNDGRTTTHEVGHWLGLYHIYQEFCKGTTPETCNKRGDKVCDTPQMSSSGWCGIITNSCEEKPIDLPDMVNNYMNIEPCSNMFTIGQKQRVYEMIKKYRPTFLSPNLKKYLCTREKFVAFFTADKNEICPGETVNFKDISRGQITSRKWIFPGGKPYTSSQINPKVTYNTPGIYDVTLIISNENDTDTVTIPYYIKVKDVADATPTLVEDFESGSFETNNWNIINPDGSITWLIVNAPDEKTENKAAFMRFYYYDKKKERDMLVSRNIDLRNASNPVLSFDHAYTTYSFPGYRTDSLIIYAIDVCEDKQYRLLSLGEDGSYNFITVPPEKYSFRPFSETEWCGTSELNTPCYYVSLKQFVGKIIKLKFEAYNNNENNLFIDNIIVKDALPDNKIIENNIKVFPSITSGKLNILNQTVYKLNANIYNSLGKLIKKIYNIPYEMVIDVEKFAPGIYFIEFIAPTGETEIIKFVKI